MLCTTSAKRGLRVLDAESPSQHLHAVAHEHQPDAGRLLHGAPAESFMKCYTSLTSGSIGAGNTQNSQFMILPECLATQASMIVLHGDLTTSRDSMAPIESGFDAFPTETGESEDVRRFRCNTGNVSSWRPRCKMKNLLGVHVQDPRPRCKLKLTLSKLTSSSPLDPPSRSTVATQPELTDATAVTAPTTSSPPRPILSSARATEDARVVVDQSKRLHTASLHTATLAWLTSYFAEQLKQSNAWQRGEDAAQVASLARPLHIVVTCVSLAAGDTSHAAHGSSRGSARELCLEHATLCTQSIDSLSHGVCMSMIARLALKAPSAEAEVQWQATKCLGARLLSAVTTSTPNALASAIAELLNNARQRGECISCVWYGVSLAVFRVRCIILGELAPCELLLQATPCGLSRAVPFAVLTYMARVPLTLCAHSMVTLFAAQIFSGTLLSVTPTLAPSLFAIRPKRGQKLRSTGVDGDGDGDADYPIAVNDGPVLEDNTAAGDELTHTAEHEQPGDRMTEKNEMNLINDVFTLDGDDDVVLEDNVTDEVLIEINEPDAMVWLTSTWLDLNQEYGNDIVLENNEDPQCNIMGFADVRTALIQDTVAPEQTLYMAMPMGYSVVPLMELPAQFDTMLIRTPFHGLDETAVNIQEAWQNREMAHADQFQFMDSRNQCNAAYSSVHNVTHNRLLDDYVLADSPESISLAQMHCRVFAGSLGGAALGSSGALINKLLGSEARDTASLDVLLEIASNGLGGSRVRDGWTVATLVRMYGALNGSPVTLNDTLLCLFHNGSKDVSRGESFDGSLSLGNGSLGLCGGSLACDSTDSGMHTDGLLARGVCGDNSTFSVALSDTYGRMFNDSLDKAHCWTLDSALDAAVRRSDHSNALSCGLLSANAGVFTFDVRVGGSVYTSLVDRNTLGGSHASTPSDIHIACARTGHMRSSYSPSRRYESRCSSGIGEFVALAATIVGHGITPQPQWETEQYCFGVMMLQWYEEQYAREAIRDPTPPILKLRFVSSTVRTAVSSIRLPCIDRLDWYLAERTRAWGEPLDCASIGVMTQCECAMPSNWQQFLVHGASHERTAGLDAFASDHGGLDPSSSSLSLSMQSCSAPSCSGGYNKPHALSSDLISAGRRDRTIDVPNNGGIAIDGQFAELATRRRGEISSQESMLTRDHDGNRVYIMGEYCSVITCGDRYCICFDDAELHNALHDGYKGDRPEENSTIARRKTEGFYDLTEFSAVQQNLDVAVNVIEDEGARRGTHDAMLYRLRCIAAARVIQTSLRDATIRRNSRASSIPCDAPAAPDFSRDTYPGPNPHYQMAVDARLAELVKMGPSMERRLTLLAEQARQRIEAIMINEACIADDQVNEMCDGDLPGHKDGTLTSVELKSKLLEKVQQLEDMHITGYDFCRFLTSWPAHGFIEPSQYSLRHSDFLHRPNVSYLKEWPPKLEKSSRVRPAFLGMGQRVSGRRIRRLSVRI